MKKEEIIEILNSNEKNEWLFKTSDETRKKYVGNEVHLRALIEFSNVCKRMCKYCGLQSTNKNIERYRLSKEEIIFCAKSAVSLGYKTIVLQSGEDDYFSTDKMIEIIKEIKKFDVALTLSIGEKSFEEYKAYKKAGADRYLLRIETTDNELYQKMHPNMSLENRKRCLEDLKTLGYEVGSGCLVGLANQTTESLANDILFFKEIDADMIGIGPFIPHQDTPLKDEKAGSFELALKVMALTRVILKDINIPATTAMETLNKNGRLIALQCGANVIMPNFTLEEYSKKYEIYPNKATLTEDIETRELVEKLGRTISNDYGGRIR